MGPQIYVPTLGASWPPPRIHLRLVIHRFFNTGIDREGLLVQRLEFFAAHLTGIEGLLFRRFRTFSFPTLPRGVCTDAILGLDGYAF